MSMDAFFEQLGVKLIETRPWHGDGTRSWFTVKSGLSRDAVASLLETLPAGGSVQFFDVEHPEVSDPGAFVTITRWPGEWTVAWSNHGWSSSQFPLSCETAVDYFSACYDADWGRALGQGSAKRLMADFKPVEKLNGEIVREPSGKYQTFLAKRLA